MRCQSCCAPFKPDKYQRCSYCGVPLAESKTLISSVRIETVSEKAEVIIPKLTRIPYVLSEIFSTAVDYQKTIELHLLQGEGEFTNQNRSLGKFQFEVSPPQPKAVPQIEITFSINSDGLMSMSAVNLENQMTKTFHKMTLDIY